MFLGLAKGGPSGPRSFETPAALLLLTIKSLDVVLRFVLIITYDKNPWTWLHRAYYYFDRNQESNK